MIDFGKTNLRNNIISSLNEIFSRELFLLEQRTENFWKDLDHVKLELFHIKNESKNEITRLAELMAKSLIPSSISNTIDISKSSIDEKSTFSKKQGSIKQIEDIELIIKSNSTNANLHNRLRPRNSPSPLKLTNMRMIFDSKAHKRDHHAISSEKKPPYLKLYQGQITNLRQMKNESNTTTQNVSKGAIKAKVFEVERVGQIVPSCGKTQNLQRVGTGINQKKVDDLRQIEINLNEEAVERKITCVNNEKNIIITENEEQE